MTSDNIKKDGNCIYCNSLCQGEPILYKGQSFDFCEECKNTFNRIQYENGHLILLYGRDDKKTYDERTCLICGKSQYFTADGDIEGTRFTAVPCV